MKIGIIGSGNMGRAIGIRLAQSGHSIFFGARRPDQGRSASAKAGGGARHGTNDEAVGFADVLIWTIRDPDPQAVLRNPEALKGKTVIDLNNRDYASGVRGGGWFDRSIAEQLQSAAPDAKVIKAFNTIAMETFDTDRDSLKAAGAQTFLAGSDTRAKAIAAELAGDLGFESVDVGDDATALRAVEALGDAIRVLMIDGGRGGRANLQVATLPEPTLGAIGSREASNYR